IELGQKNSHQQTKSGEVKLLNRMEKEGFYSLKTCLAPQLTNSTLHFYLTSLRQSPAPGI
ncbi:MAG: hypothetical protein AABW85_04335, partial [archaeon]